MPTNQEVTMSVQNNQGSYIPLYPITTQQQVVGWNTGTTYGPFTITLQQSNWQNMQQTVAVEGVLETDFIWCTKILSGDEPPLKIQNINYSFLNPTTGINSMNGYVQFNCINAPMADFQVQIEWTR